MSKQNYWVVVSKRDKKLWEPTHEGDECIVVYWTKEAAEYDCMDGYMPIEVTMEIIKK